MTCAKCGTRFEAERSRRRYCSPACKKGAERARLLQTIITPTAPPEDVTGPTFERVCLRCGRHFETIRDSARYCSNACRQAAFRERRKEKVEVTA